MSKKENTTNVTVNNTNNVAFSLATFTTDSLLSSYQKDVATNENGNSVVKYEMILQGKGDVQDYTLTDQMAIAAIEGIRQADKLEKYASYRKGAFLVQLVDSPFMRDNQVASISELAKNYELGVETSTANALESVSRKLGVSFDELGNMHFADDTLPQLSFWHYSQIVSLVQAKENGGYDYSNLHEFLELAHVSPLMSQKRLKELFNDYRNGRIEGQQLALPDSVTEKAKKDAERVAKAEKEKKSAEDAKKIVSAKVAIDLAQSFVDKQSVAISAVQALRDCLTEIGVDFDLTEIMSAIASAKAPQATPVSKTNE